MATYLTANFKQQFINKLPSFDNTYLRKKSIFNYFISGLLLIVVFFIISNFYLPRIHFLV